MSKVSEALRDVWTWQEEIYEERKRLTLSEWAKASKESSSRTLEEYGIKKEGKVEEGI